MPFTAEEISIAGKTSIDYDLKNRPIDQIKIQHPWSKKLMAGKKSYPGGKQFITEQLRYRYQNNFQFYNGRTQVTYNIRDSVEKALYEYRGAHDGFSLDEDRLVQNGITLTDSKTSVNTDAERVMLTNLMEEQTTILRLGFDEQMEKALLRDGSAGADDIHGLDLLISTNPTTGVIGGINRATAGNEYWRNNFANDLTIDTDTGTIIDQMEIGWRACTRNGGMPNFIMAGSKFIDGYRNFMMKTYHQIHTIGGEKIDIDGGVGRIAFKGLPIIWNPMFSVLDTEDSPGIEWEKRCYFINTEYIRLRPIEGHDMISRKPPRPYDRYEYYWGLTWKGQETLSRANAHWVGDLL